MVQTPSQSALLPAAQALDRSPSAPAVLRRAGKNALFAADEFFAARISNPHTRRAVSIGAVIRLKLTGQTICSCAISLAFV